MKTPIQCQSENRFVALMSELFQMDEAQALDFGIYRVIRRHNRDILAYLGEVVTAPDGQQSLQATRAALKPNDKAP